MVLLSAAKPFIWEKSRSNSKGVAEGTFRRSIDTVVLVVLSTFPSPSNVISPVPTPMSVPANGSLSGESANHR